MSTLVIRQGKTLRRHWLWCNPVPGSDPPVADESNPIDMTGYSARLQVRRRSSSIDPALLSFTDTPGEGLTINGPAGTVDLEITGCGDGGAELVDRGLGPRGGGAGRHGDRTRQRAGRRQARGDAVSDTFVVVEDEETTVVVAEVPTVVVVSSPGPQGPRGVSGGSFVEHNQDTPVTQDTIDHGLGRVPSWYVVEQGTGDELDPGRR